MHTDKIVALLHIYTKYVYLVVCGHIVAAGSAPFFFLPLWAALRLHLLLSITIYVSAYYYTPVRILLYHHTTICVLILLYVIYVS